jgi:hypothetical protein
MHKPDLVVASNRLLHSLVFELKGGKTLDIDQLKRYSSLMPNDLRWVTVFDRTHLQLDVCICDFAENHSPIKMINQQFPMLTFGSEYLTKEGTFKRDKLNEAFGVPIDLRGKLQPLSFYPFSDEDEDSYIAVHVVRTLLSIALKNAKGGPDVFEEKIITFDEIIASKFNYVWKVLSLEHKKALKSKISEVIERFLAKERVKESLGLIQQKKGYKITRNLEQFKKEAEEFIEELQSQTPLSDFMQLKP